MEIKDIIQKIRRSTMRYLTATAAALLLTAAGISQDTFFSISPSFTTDTEVPAVTVLTPNGGEEFAAGSIITVEWEAVGLSESFTDAIFISVRFAPGEDGIMLGEYLPNSGSVDVTLPEIGSYTAELAVAAADNFLNVGYDITDAVFTILLSGCTDPTACNYNPLANAENGSCIYPEPEICNDGLDNDCNGFTDLDDLACSESVYLSVPDTYPTIQSAIDAAIDGMIVLVAPGTYTENINFSSKNITVASHFILEDDPGMIEATVIDGNAAGRTVTIVNGENDAVLIGFSIVNGIAAGESTVGGGILLYGSSPRIEYCNIHDNSAGNYGGGLSISGGANPILSHLNIYNNSSLNAGGINCYQSSATLTNILVYENTAGNLGGGMVLASCPDVQINKTTISDNTAGYGGAIEMSNSNVWVNNSILWNNSPQEVFFHTNASTNFLSLAFSDVMGGQEAMVVENGILEWGEGMIVGDPLFAGRMTEDYYLTMGSPCIDAGDPDPAQNDPDGSRSDMGAFQYRYDDLNFVEIFDIQFTSEPGENGDYPSLLEGEFVSTTGIVSGIGYAGNDHHFFISSPAGGPWNSIFLYTADVIPSLGDRVIATGEIIEYFGWTEIYYPAVTIVSSGNPVPEPILVQTGDLILPESAEAYENCLVRVENVTVTAGENEYGEWYVDDGSGACQIDDRLYLPTLGDVGDFYPSITGLLDYQFNQYGINPRFAEDLPGLPGDLDQSGSIDVLDIVIMVGIIMGDEASDYQLWAADLDQNGSVDVLDIVITVGIIMGG